MTNLKTIKATDSVSIVFGEWFDRTYGNTYWDAVVYVNDERVPVPYRYGYNHGDRQAVEEALKEAGYRLRTDTRDHWRPFRRVHVSVVQKKKRELITMEDVA